MTQTILDRVLEHELLRVNIGSRIKKILEIGEEVGEWDLYVHLMDSSCNITWTVCNGFLRVRLERCEYDYGTTDEYVVIPFEWLSMDDRELKQTIQDRVELTERHERERAIEQLRRDAAYYGYALVEI